MAPVLTAIAIGHGLSNWLPTLLRAEGLTPTVAGLAAAAYIAFGVAGALALPGLATVRTRRWRVAGALLVEALLIPALVVPSTALVGVALVVLGIATGSLPPLLILALFDTEGLGNRAGAVTGIYYTVAGLAGLSGPLVIGWLVDASGGFGAGLLALTFAAVLGAAFGLQLGGARTGKAAARQPELTVLP
jgi:cyanate permease